jgi:hypothetical protein
MHKKLTLYSVNGIHTTFHALNRASQITSFDKRLRKDKITQNALREVRNMKNPFQYGVWFGATLSVTAGRKSKIF